MIKFSQLKTIKAQRLRIIKDTIAQILAHKFFANSGAYFNIKNDNTPFTDVKSIIPSEGVTCEVCGIGGLLGACILNVNKVTTDDDYSDQRFAIDKLDKWFSEKQLLMIECAFELGVVGNSRGKALLFKAADETFSDNCISGCNCNSKEDCKRQLKQGGKLLLPEVVRACKFGMRYKNINNRYLAILNNMLKNGGEFKP